MKGTQRSVIVGLAAGLLASCASSGVGTGELVRRNSYQTEPVVFTWRTGADHLRGDIFATLPDGETYSGRFFEVTSTTQADTLAPLWVGWNPWWTDWPWAPYAYVGPNFITNYSGRVLATLVGPGGKRMRCRFYMAMPESGMVGGGQGKCQFRDGTVIDAMFPPS